MQDVLQADWQEVWHSPHPPFFIVSFKFLVFNVLIRFMRLPPSINILLHLIIAITLSVIITYQKSYEKSFYVNTTINVTIQPYSFIATIYALN